MKDHIATIKRAIERKNVAMLECIDLLMLSDNIFTVGKTREGFAKSVRTVLDIRPQRVALFHYAHVPWLKRHQTALDMDAVPDSDLKMSIFLDALAAFDEAGYVYIGLDHFALPDDELALAHAEKTLNRNFMGYTTLRGTELVSLGVSSICEVDGAFVQNDPQEFGYLERIEKEGFATLRGHVLCAEDQLRRDVILGLMCNGELRKDDIAERHAIDFDEHFAEELAALAPLAEDGLVSLDADALRLTPLGQLFMRNVALPFDTYYAARKLRGETGKGTFSKTL